MFRAQHISREKNATFCGVFFEKMPDFEEISQNRPDPKSPLSGGGIYPIPM